MKLAKPVCMAACMDHEGWTWHERCVHLYFESLDRLSSTNKVCGLPAIRQVNQVCDDCLLCKQHHAPFLSTVRCRAEEHLELVHGDLCGLITLATHGGKHHFLLLINGMMSHYMWLILRRTKDEAPDAIRWF